MDSSEVLRQATQSIGAKSIASEMGLSPSLIYKWCQPNDAPDDSGADNPLDRLARLIDLTDDNSIVEWLCQHRNGHFTHNPEVKPGEEKKLFLATQSIVKEFSELLEIISSSYAVGDRITKKEAMNVRKEWEDLKRVAESFVVACEHGVYDKKQEDSE